jgi:hypothetical protein
MRFRKLRIAWSVACLIACVLLIVLWVRSYWWGDIVEKSTGIKAYQFQSARGHFAFSSLDPTRDNATLPAIVVTEIMHSATLGRTHTVRPASHLFNPLNCNVSGFGRISDDVTRGFIAPYWFPTLVLATLAGIPWIHYRFSLRTLLIAATLVAVILGAIVYAVK